MIKNNHVLAAYDASGNFEIIGKPQSADEAKAALRKLQEEGSDSFEKVALINLRRGTDKRRPIPAKAKSQPKKAKSE